MYAARLVFLALEVDLAKENSEPWIQAPQRYYLRSADCESQGEPKLAHPQFVVRAFAVSGLVLKVIWNVLFLFPIELEIVKQLISFAERLLGTGHRKIASDDQFVGYLQTQEPVVIV